MEGQSSDPSRLRVSDEDRHKVAEMLRQAAGEGRIDLDELDQRLEAAYAAKTYGELVPITSTCRPTGAHPGRSSSRSDGATCRQSPARATRARSRSWPSASGSAAGPSRTP